MAAHEPPFSLRRWIQLQLNMWPNPKVTHALQEPFDRPEHPCPICGGYVENVTLQAKLDEDVLVAEVAEKFTREGDLTEYIEGGAFAEEIVDFILGWLREHGHLWEAHA